MAAAQQQQGCLSQLRTQVLLAAIILTSFILVGVRQFGSSSAPPLPRLVRGAPAVSLRGPLASSNQGSKQLPAKKLPWTLPYKQPLVVAHRGASADLPEQARETFLLAIAQGADTIECDVHPTKDLALVCRHDPTLDSSTNVRELPQFAQRLATRQVEEHTWTGVFVSDLTLAELRQLRVKQPWPFRDQRYNGRFTIVTLEEFLDVALKAKRNVGVHLEVKHPRYYSSLPSMRAANTTIEDLVLGILEERGFGGPMNSPQWLKRPSFILCFDPIWLKAVARLGSCIPRLLLLKGEMDEVGPSGQTPRELLADESLASLASYVSVVGPGKGLLAVRNATSGAYESTRVMERLQQRGFAVHPYTAREEQQFLFPGLTLDQELDLLLVRLGASAIISDSPGPVRAFLERQPFDLEMESRRGRAC